MFAKCFKHKNKKAMSSGEIYELRRNIRNTPELFIAVCCVSSHTRWRPFHHSALQTCDLAIIQFVSFLECIYTGNNKNTIS